MGFPSANAAAAWAPAKCGLRTDVHPGVFRAPCWCRASSSGTSWVATEFSASASRCSWTLCNPNLPRYKLCMKVATVPACSIPACVGIYQLESFLESTPSYLGLEGCDEVLRLCDSSGPLAFLKAGKQFLQMKGQLLPQNDDPGLQGGALPPQQQLLRGTAGHGQPQPP
ncbi:Adhesion G protein-coupled receptor B1 [Camelus dromedarius]|uniref:Adhesion G protein-coupled receptor B1 n=1 Tax=Camelus dromedarius TaxID=9838 RepID=A0A5N4CCX1_CAMDR|nr:Adhesion G protein-coupled receptor B1 [Camelus dromedarius]